MSTRPKTLRYREALDAAEQRIVDALPEIIDGLIARAKEGDLKAAIYLLDRIMGKTAGAKTAPADDRQAPYSEEDFEEDEHEREENRELFAFLEGRQRRAGQRTERSTMGLVYRNGRPYLYESVRRGRQGHVAIRGEGRGCPAHQRPGDHRPGRAGLRAA